MRPFHVFTSALSHQVHGRLYCGTHGRLVNYFCYFYHEDKFLLLKIAVSKTENAFLACFFRKADGTRTEVGFVSVKMLPQSCSHICV